MCMKMSTFPRSCNNRQKPDLSFPFSSSPRKLQDMTLADGNDVTCVSGMSMKQYEEQLNNLKKENFHLKLRIYFLEEKLGCGQPPKVQGMLEHNVHLQVEVEELRRQLCDKQQLLAAAAQAIDVLENQGSISLDSDTSMNGASTLQKKMQNLEEQGLDNMKPSVTNTQAIQPVTDETTDGLSAAPDQDELLKLKREHHKALQMIQSCMKRIQQQEKQIKKLKSENEATQSQASDSHVDKYEEILKCKDQHIQNLEQRLRQAHISGDLQAGDNSQNLQELLTRRLQGLAYFLDRLLSHKCVLGEDKMRLAESLLEQSLALPVGLRLDESVAPGDLTVDDVDVSATLRLEDLTAIFGHHGLGDCAVAPGRRSQADLLQCGRERPSDSECWSEPDRNVSLARIGIGEANASLLSGCDERRRAARRPRRAASAEAALLDELAKLRQQVHRLEESERHARAELQSAEERARTLREDVEELKAASEETQRLRSEVGRLTLQLDLEASRCGEAETRAALAADSLERLRAEMREREREFADSERALRRAADEAAVHASQAALERTRAQHERSRLEREVEELRERLAAPPAPPAPVRAPSDDERPTSPDQGIDSDRLSSLELAEQDALSPRSLYEENATLKQKLARAKATLADTLAQLNAANVRKMNVQRAICREIHKTHGVLRQARDQFESHN